MRRCRHARDQIIIHNTAYQQIIRFAQHHLDRAGQQVDVAPHRVAGLILAVVGLVLADVSNELHSGVDVFVLGLGEDVKGRWVGEAGW